MEQSDGSAHNMTKNIKEHSSHIQSGSKNVGSEMRFECLKVRAVTDENSSGWKQQF